MLKYFAYIAGLYIGVSSKATKTKNSLISCLNACHYVLQNVLCDLTFKSCGTI